MFRIEACATLPPYCLQELEAQTTFHSVDFPSLVWMTLKWRDRTLPRGQSATNDLVFFFVPTLLGKAISSTQRVFETPPAASWFQTQQEREPRQGAYLVTHDDGVVC